METDLPTINTGKYCSFLFKPREFHPELFEDGESMLVALQVSHKGGKPYWHIEPITIRTDEDFFAILDINGEDWGWTWEDVQYWAPMSELFRTFS